MREFCEKRGWTVAAEFIDAGYRGSTMDRPGLQGLLAALGQRVFDVVVVHELYNASIIPFGYKAEGDARTPPAVDPQAVEGIRLAFETLCCCL